jgi:SSS family solute:Na+ symporter
MPVLGSPIWWTIVSAVILGVGIGVLAQPQLAVRFMMVKSNRELNRAVLVGGIFILMMTGVAFVVGGLSNVFFFREAGKIAVEVVEKGNVDLIIPAYINAAMPPWFVYLFMITLLSAAMSTSSGQLHAMGTAFGRDIFSKSKYSADYKEERRTKGVIASRIGILIGVIVSFILGYFLPVSVVARATSLFFGLCAATFLPMYILGLFWKRANKAGAMAGMITGIISSLFWILFVHEANSKIFGIVNAINGQTSLLPAPWKSMDSIVIAFPLAFIITIIVTLCTKPMPKEMVDAAFKKEVQTD